MPIIKYYDKNTWYSGREEDFFVIGDTPPKVAALFYPDEYLIVDILRLYCQKRGFHLTDQIQILHEPWSLNSNDSRDQEKAVRGNGNLISEGEENSERFFREIVPSYFTSKADEKSSPKNNTLLLIPFLLGRHHPGIAIDPQKKCAIYLDPKAWACSKYPKAECLITLLKEMGIETSEIRIPQQAGNDSNNCGPILAASMMEWVEAFMQGNPLSSVKFTRHRGGLAADRLWQMYINNSSFAEEGKATDLQRLTSEIMLADVELWQDFLKEKQVPEAKEILSIIQTNVNQQKKWITETAQNRQKQGETRESKDVSDSAFHKMREIINYQVRMIECLFLENAPLKHIEMLKSPHAASFQDKAESKADFIEQRNLFEAPHFAQVQTLLGELRENKPRSSFQAVTEGKPASISSSTPAMPSLILGLLSGGATGIVAGLYLPNVTQEYWQQMTVIVLMAICATIFSGLLSAKIGTACQRQELTGENQRSLIAP